MSAEIQLTSAADSVEFPYRAMSSSAIASVVFALFALLGGIFFLPALALAVIGLLVGLVGFRQISKFPDEYDGRSIAICGLALNATVLVAGVGMHSYVYLTEVPDGYSRVHFWELQQDDDGPSGPTEKALLIDGEQIFLKGYIHPSSGSGMLKRFILVPDLGTCCFGGQPKSSDMIEVALVNGETTKAGLIKKKLAGTFMVNRAPQRVTDFDNTVFYRMNVDLCR